MMETPSESIRVNEGEPSSKRSASVSDYLSLIKFSHTVFALPFALIGFFLATWHHHHPFRWETLALVVACMVLARTAAMAFNRWADRRIDAINERTQRREIPSGRIHAGAALMLAIICALLFVVTTYFINALCFYLSPIALVVILGYSYSKRFTAFSHIILGVGLSLAPIGAYLAVAGGFDLLPILISCAVLFWVSGFDIIYALADVEFDRGQRLKSIPAWIGIRHALVVSTLLHLLTAGSLITAGWIGEFGVLYWIGFAVFLAMLVYQHSLVKPSDLSRINLAFFTANGIASVIFAGFAIGDLWRSAHGAGLSN